MRKAPAFLLLCLALAALPAASSAGQSSQTAQPTRPGPTVSINGMPALPVPQAGLGSRADPVGISQEAAVQAGPEAQAGASLSQAQALPEAAGPAAAQAQPAVLAFQAAPASLPQAHARVGGALARLKNAFDLLSRRGKGGSLAPRSSVWARGRR